MGGQPSNEINYLYPMPNSKEKGFTHVYRNPKFHNQLTASPDPSIQTYRDIVLQSCTQKFPNNNLAGKIIVNKVNKDGKQVEERQIQAFTYKQILEQGDYLGKAILTKKLQFRQKTQGMKFVGIYSKNRVQWLITDFACVLYGLTSIPLYDTLGLQNLSYCLNQTEMTTLFLSSATLKVLLDLKDHGNLKNVVLYDPIDKQTAQRAKKLGFNVINFNELIEEGKMVTSISYKDIILSPTDIYTFSYTSGTTGPPKGAMLSHRNITSFLASLNNHDVKFSQDDTYLSFLPLPHIFQRVVISGIVYLGAYAVFYSGDMLKIKDDCQVVKPTLFIAVPRIYNRIIEKVQEGFQEKTGITKCLVDSAVSSKLQSIQKNGDLDHFFYDKIVFSKVKQMFGGRIRKMITGSAPLSKKNFMLMELLMSAPMFEGYGSTQNTAGSFMKVLEDKVVGHVGGIISNLEFKLSDIPQMKYTSDDKDQNGNPSPRGQLWLRGPGIFSGYYKLKDKTDQAITKDGWLKTGDVGVLLAEGGRMRIIDRKKNIFKLQQGQYVAPDKVENFYVKSPYVQQVFVYGQSLHNFCIAVVKPKKQHFEELAKKNNINGAYEQLCKNIQMRKLVIKDMFALGKNGGLNTFQQAKNIYLEPKSFADKNILTNTLKLQRFEAKNVYKNIIEDLYKQGQLPVK